MAVASVSLSPEEFATYSPERLLQWARAEYGDRAGIITSFQDTGNAMVDMAQRVAPGTRVLTVDTLRLHPETYALMEQMERRYGITVERFTPDLERVGRMTKQHGEYLFFDTKAKQEYCCEVRKVGPIRRALSTLDVWFTGLRRDQSAFRQATPKVSWVKQPDGRRILKIAPLADWTQEDVDAYVRKNNVPKNALYDQGYTSIGCVICTTPTLPGEDKRAGRWRWFNQINAGDKKECGIHTFASGI